MNDLRSRSSSKRIAVCTFEPHPLTVLRPQDVPTRLTPPALKQRLLEDAGVDDYVVLAPEPQVLRLSAEEFWHILRDETRPTHLIEGDTFNFGKDRRGTIDRLCEWTIGTGVELHIVGPVQAVLLNLHIAPVSSSLIRWLLQHGRVRDAAICLGRAYAIRGVVIEGYRRGRTIGVPTANLKCDGQQTIPLNGAYAGRCEIQGTIYPAAINVGLAPTFGETVHQIEAHLIGFDGDLYGQTLEVQIVDWVRDQVRFGSIEALKAQIQQDLHVVQLRASANPALPIAAA
jgi:riboflavin kinase/FMN adenylyltransferase